MKLSIKRNKLHQELIHISNHLLTVSQADSKL